MAWRAHAHAQECVVRMLRQESLQSALSAACRVGRLRLVHAVMCLVDAAVQVPAPLGTVL